MPRAPKKVSHREVVMSVAEKAAALAIQNLESELTLVRRVQELLRTQPATRPLRFKVKLISLWADHGEQPVTIERTGRLDMAIKTAEREFVKQNKRSDFQVRYYVWLMVRQGKQEAYEIVLPDAIWHQYTARAQEAT